MRYWLRTRSTVLLLIILVISFSLIDYFDLFNNDNIINDNNIIFSYVVIAVLYAGFILIDGSIFLFEIVFAQQLLGKLPPEVSIIVPFFLCTLLVACLASRRVSKFISILSIIISTIGLIITIRFPSVGYPVILHLFIASPVYLLVILVAINSMNGFKHAYRH